MADPTAPLIVTFYSYKGGTGRSMALANVAWILAANGHRVAVVDWDLEAPGLHRYLHPYLRDPDLTDSSGIIDFVMAYSREAIRPAKRTIDKSWYVPYANLLRHATSLRYDFPKNGTIDFIPSGRQGPDYAARVNSFNWSAFYEKHQGGIFLEAAKLSLAPYQYVLIDSRTGVSDTSGICTVQMPQVLVVCFTPNTQSIQGAAAIARSADQQRTRPDGTRTLTILPVMTRVLTGESARVEAARRAARDRFDSLLWHLGGDQARNRYWGRMQVPQQPFYGFEEVLAVFGDHPGRTNTMLAAMETLAGYIQSAGPGVDAVPDPLLRLPALEDAARRAELAKFVTMSDEAEGIDPNEQAHVKRTPPLSHAETPPLPILAPPTSGSPPPSPPLVSPGKAPLDHRTYRYWFYISYAHDRPDPYLEEFSADLSRRVEESTGAKQPGFFDRAGIDLGSSWRAEVLDALATTRTFVPMISPNYVASEYCGKEWQVFSSRQQGSHGMSGIVPVLWAPVRTLPEPVERIEIFSGQMQETYRQDGLLFLMRLSRFRADYHQFVDAFAERLIRVGQQSPVPLGGELPQLDAVPSAFARPAVPRPDERAVRFVVVVGNWFEMKDVRQAPVPYEAGRSEWRPYGDMSVQTLALTVAATLGEFGHITDDLKTLDNLWSTREIGIVLIDAWALTIDRIRLDLERCDERSPTTWAYVIVFDEHPDTIARTPELRARVDQVLSRAGRLQGRVQVVHSEPQLKDTLAKVATRLRLELISTARSAAPPPELS